MSKSRSLRMRLVVSFVAVLSLGVVLGGVAIIELKSAVNASKMSGINAVPSLQLAEKMTRNILSYREAELQHVISTDVSVMAAEEATMAKASSDAVAAMDEYQKLLMDDIDTANLNAVRSSFEKLTKLSVATLAQSKQGNKTEAAKLAGGEEDQVLVDEVHPALDHIRDYNLELADGWNADGDHSANLATLILAVGLIAMVGIGLTIALRISGKLAGELQSTTDVLNTTAGRLGDVASSATASADKTAMSASTAAAASEQMSSSVQTVATAVEEMNASISDIANNAHEAAQVTNKAAVDVQEARDVVERLGEASREIGSVVAMISEIAEQTNLLALNATIEAARAGEAGKGFAVVAAEVKELSQSTGKATDEIAQRIERIRHDTTVAVEGMQTIAEVMSLIVERSTSIAGAVEEQSAATAEIARSIAEASAASNSIAGEVSALASLAVQNRESAELVSASSREINAAGGDLSTIITG
ncbi:MAG: methyl-accepting chemotaxis protein [Acidimicrobiia bacterium]